MKHSMEEEKDGFEFDDLETDERINIDIYKFDMAFPDPQNYCIGFVVKTPTASQIMIEEAKSAKKNRTLNDPLLSSGATGSLP